MGRKVKDRRKRKITFRQFIEGTRFERHINYVTREARENWLKGLVKNGFDHSQRIESYLNRLVPLDIKKEMPLAEIYLLLCAVYLHDVGYKIDAEQHISAGARDIKRNYRKYGFEDRYIAGAVSWICSRHGPEKDYPVGEIERDTGIAGLSENVLDLPFLGALLRIADELDNAYSRANDRGYQPENLRYLIKYVRVDTTRWLIEFQTAPSKSLQWKKLDRMRKYVQERLNDLLDIFDSRRLYYHKYSVTMRPAVNPFMQKSREIFAQRPLEPHLAQIMVGLEPDISILWDYVNATRGKEFDEVRFLGGNALTLLKVLGDDFRGKDLSGTVLVNADLSYTDFTETKFNRADLRGAKMKYTILKNASLLETKLERTVFDGPNEIYDLAWSPNGAYIAVAGKEPVLRLVDTKTFTEVAKLEGHKNDVNCISWSYGSDKLITGSTDDTIRIWELDKRACVGLLPCHIGGVKKLQLAKDGQRILCVGPANRFKIWDLQKDEPNEVKVKIHDEIRSIVSTDDLEFTFMGSLYGSIGVLSKPYQNNFEIITKVPASAEYLALSSDRKRLYVGCADNKVRVIHIDYKDTVVQEGLFEMKGIYLHRGSVKSLALSPDDARLTSGDGVSRIIAWDTKSCESVDVLIGHEGSVNCLDFSPCGNFLVSGGTDKTIRIWNLNPRSENMGELLRYLGSDCSGMQFEGATGTDRNGIEFLLRRNAKVNSGRYVRTSSLGA